MISVAIASILKPVNEVRMYKRFAVSLAKTNKYEINIIGIESKIKNTPSDNIHFHTYKTAGRSPVNRLKCYRQYIHFVKEIDPDVIIITSPELLVINRFINRKKRAILIYDLQEDYYINIIYQRIYSWPFNYLLAKIIRQIEIKLSRKYDYIFLAESSYKKEIPFLNKSSNTLVLENKSVDLPSRKKAKNKQPLNILFSGVVSEYAGIYQTLEVYKKLKRINPNTTLTIAGICYQEIVKVKLIKACENDSDITWIGGHDFVPHDLIVEQISQADLGIIAYQPNEINQHKMPGKLYEYTALGLPHIIHHQSSWYQYSKRFGLAIPVDFSNLNAPQILKKYSEIIESEIILEVKTSLWTSVEEDFINCINQLTKQC